MISISAILRVKSGHEATMRDALLEMMESVRDEPGTVGYFISQSLDEPQVFTTYERFSDGAAMERHNNSAAVAKVMRIAEPILAGKIVLYSSNELATKERE
jgi:quinol monooxygenase YgiN